MDYTKPEHDAAQVNKAGRVLASYMDGKITLDEALDWVPAIENFRAAHNFPLNSFHVTLKSRALKIAKTAITAQRTKRLESIALKLADQERMKLTQMQDIGGCRAIMPTISQLRKLHKLYVSRPLKHPRGNDKDYISEPKATGYRGIHIKYRFAGKGNSLPWDDLKIEIQLRTMLQHKWATAVEAAQSFTKNALKANRGNQEWLRFFALMSSVLALKEGCPTVPGTPTTYDELREEIRALNDQHHFQGIFSQYGRIIPQLEKGMFNARYFLVTLDPVRHAANVRGFKSHQLQEATQARDEAETELPIDSPTQVVLVSVSSIKALKLAYPNYFLDTQDFLHEVADVTGIAPVVRTGRVIAATMLRVE